MRGGGPDQVRGEERGGEGRGAGSGRDQAQDQRERRGKLGESSVGIRLDQNKN